MRWRRANAMLAICCAGVLIGSCILWIIAWVFDFIGDTRFIGHVSMVALVLGAASTLTGSIAAWRADVPDKES